jgi:hypothetical protein
MDGTQISVLKQADKVSLRGLLQRKHRRALEPEIGLEVLRYLANESLERKLADEQLRGFLVLADLPEGHCPWPVPVGLLHSARGWGRLACCLGGQLLAGSLASRRLAGCLLGTRHSCNGNGKEGMETVS